MSLPRLFVSAAFFVAALLLAAAPAGAHDFKLGSLDIQHPWARPSAAKTGAAYFVITNHGASEDALVGVETGASEKAQIHEMTMDGAIMRMRAIARLVLPAGGTVSVAPGGVHVMLIGLKGPLKDGASFPMTLVFEKAGRIEVTVEVQTPDEMRAGEAGSGHDMHDMNGMGGMH
ncbi:MAG: copper chaperone PCu(A)C [Parvibaculum sp.]|uniref:copper chaperone PCu(A)C n=1 Tax=Parvibaculum sp. TaxID=2024848 RepID=UPI0028478D7E|nr:copper chaperone PCu(A)C [Parvibaculum sp.]MDR3499680.1 copper chaperone PCu(A)C [Parvibaculum sp.]